MNIGAQFAGVSNQWDRFINGGLLGGGLSEKVQKKLGNLIEKPLSKTDLQTKLNTVLADSDFYGKTVDHIHESMKLADPKLDKKKMIYGLNKTKHGDLLDGLRNGNMADKLADRLEEEVGLLQGRVSRLDGYLKEGTIQDSILDIYTISETNNTRFKNLDERRKYLALKLNNKELVGEQRKQILAEYKRVDKQAKQAEKEFKKQQKEFEQFRKKYRNLSESQQKKEFEKLVRSVRAGVIGSQSSIIDSVVNSTASYQVRRLAQDQAFNLQQEANIKVRDELEKNGKPVWGRWSLSPSHTFHMAGDPCEKFAKIAVFPADKCPKPIVDTHFGCKCTVEFFVK